MLKVIEDLMKLKIMKNPVLYIALLLLPFGTMGQSNSAFPTINIKDSLEFQKVLKIVLETYPLVLKAKEGVQMAEAGVGLAKSAYYPYIDADAGYTRIGPVPQIFIGPSESIEIAPANNYNGSLSVGQMLYDFGKTKRNIKVEESNKEISEKNVEIIKQKLTLLTAISFYSLVYLQEAIVIKEVELKTLKEHLDFITRKKETGSATQYEVLTTQVKISATENQKVDLETTKNYQLGNLNSLLNFPIKTVLIVKNSYIPRNPVLQTDSLFSFAFTHRDEILLTNLVEKNAELKLSAVKTQSNPVLRAFASGGVKNGYFPDLNQPILNYTAGVGFKVTIFHPTWRKYALLQATSRINISKDETELAKRQISTEVNENVGNLIAAIQKIKQGELQVRQSDEAFTLAKINFDSGSITNIDLLDTETLVAESKLILLKSQIDLIISIVKLNLSIGCNNY
jgi:outer membrane protein TolC